MAKVAEFIMPDAFFSSNKPRKRKRVEGPKDAGSARKVARKGPSQKGFSKPDRAVNGAAKKKARADEELSEQSEGEGGGIEDLDLRPDDDIDLGASGDEDDEETPAEKRLRLAQLYLDSVKETIADGEFDAAEIDREIISTRLKQDVLENSGKIHLYIADSYDLSEPPTTVLRTRGHRFSVTSAVAAESGKYLFTSGKEGSIIKWDLSSGKRIATFHKLRPSKDAKGKKKATADDLKGHTDEIWALAMSTDGKYVASAGKDRRLVVWDSEKGEWVKTFYGTFAHRDHISGLSFRKGTYQLYTASFDRTLKVYDLSSMAYVETLFGHQDHILGVDSLRGETCVSVGARDTTLRYWKIADETQLVFRGGGRSRIREVLEGGLRGDESGDEDHDMEGEKRKERVKETKYVEGSVECVSMVDESTFISGGDSGSICLWITAKKKPVFTQPLAHGLNESPSETEGVIRTPRYITSLACLRYSDLFASGSWEGDIRLWKLDPKLKGFSLIGTIPAPGFVNSLQFISPPKEFFQSASWTSPKDSSDGRSQEDSEPQMNGVISRKPKAVEAPSLLLVAGLGQEPRLGRWMTLKEGVVNSTIVVAIAPRR